MNIIYELFNSMLKYFEIKIKILIIIIILKSNRQNKTQTKDVIRFPS